MDHYVTGSVIRALREKQRLTQAELARQLSVSDKAVSKWENGRGFPDISLIEPLSRALHISVPELLAGQAVVNENRSSNLLRSKWYVCPVCGNALFAKGQAVISCCGIPLPPLEAEEPDAEHALRIERIEDEYFISLPHEMTKQHFIAFIAYALPDRLEVKTLYPEGSAAVRFFPRGPGWLYWHCNRHGLFRQRIGR